MCGRYVSPDGVALERRFKIASGDSNRFVQRFNVAPTTIVPVICQHEHGGLALSGARWGLIPHWWKQPKLPTFSFNARSEEAVSKPMWRDAYRRSRCLIPAAGWYEWHEGEIVDGTGEVRAFKRPHFVYDPIDSIVAFAGLMSWWTNPDGERMLTCALLSKAAAPSIASVHDRMPVVLGPEYYEEWTNVGQTNAASVERMIAAAQTEFEHYPVSSRVNNARNDSPELAKRIDADTVN
jgi:putative SOS response-associated peptidase YedK